LSVSEIADDLLLGAEVYASLNYSVIPLLGDAAPDRPKTPALPWSAYQVRRAGMSDFKRWFLQDGYQALGIVTGRISSLVVLDFDTPDLFHAFSAQCPDLVHNQVVQTRRGYHIYYHLLPQLYLRTRKGQGVDLLSEGCYAVARPTVIASHEYKLIRGGMPIPLTQYDIDRITRFIDTHTAADTPLIEEAHHDAAPQLAALPPPDPYLKLGDLHAFYRVLVAQGRGRNNALFTVARTARDHGFSRAAAQSALVDLHTYTGSPDHAPEKPELRQREALHTIQSAYARDPRMPQPLPDTSPQLPTRAREALYARKLTCVVRTIEGLRDMGIRPGQTFTRKQAQALLHNLVGRDSIIFALTAGATDGQPLIALAVAPPLAPPPASDDAAEGYRLSHIKKCFFDSVTKPVKMKAGRKPLVYVMPTNSELCHQLGVRFSVSDPIQPDDLSSAKKTRQATHRELIKRRPGQYSRRWLAERLGVSVRTVQRYDMELHVRVQPMFHEQPITWETLDTIPDEPVPGMFLMDDSYKRYPAKREIAIYLLPKVWGLYLMRQEANFYSLDPPNVVFNQIWLHRMAQQKRIEQALTVEQGRAHILPAAPLQPAAQPRSGLPPSALPLRTPPPTKSAQAVQRPIKSKPPKPAPKLSKRRARKPLSNACQEALAQRVCTIINNLTSDRENRISQASARRAVFTYGTQAVESVLKRMARRRNLTKPAGFFMTVLRSESKSAFH
jgi:Bifunctional DNA primase/polymerase, N-terminal